MDSDSMYEFDKMDLPTFLSKHRCVQEKDYYKKAHGHCGLKLASLIMYTRINPFWVKVIKEHLPRYMKLLSYKAPDRFHDEWDVLWKPLLMKLGLRRWQIEPIREVTHYKVINENNYHKLLKYFLSEVGESGSLLDITTVHNLIHGSNILAGSLTGIKDHTYDLLKYILGKLDYSKCSKEWEDRKLGDLIHMGLTHEELFETLHLGTMLTGMTRKERLGFYEKCIHRSYVDNYCQRLTLECLRVYLLRQHGL